jgi:cell division protein FtsB
MDILEYFLFFALVWIYVLFIFGFNIVRKLKKQIPKKLDS